MKYRINPEIPPNIPRYPIYILSKGRADNQMTSKALTEMGVKHRIVVEPQEFEEYAKYVDKDILIKLPFSNLGRGGIPARNFIWEHSIAEGHARHWIMDDNIGGFKRVHKNLRYHAKTGAIFRAHEDFVDRYTNIKMSGLNYTTFVMAVTEYPAYYINTRIYSCILLANDIYEPVENPVDDADRYSRWQHDDNKNLGIRWYPKFNEDTKLSLNIMKRGWNTILENRFTANKAATLTMKGGNTDEVYKKATNNRYEFAKELQDAHPDVVQITKKYSRWHHHVDYRPFQTPERIKLHLKPEFRDIPSDYVDEYGMKFLIKNPNNVDLSQYVYNRYRYTIIDDKKVYIPNPIYDKK